MDKLLLNVLNLNFNVLILKSTVKDHPPDSQAHATSTFRVRTTSVTAPDTPGTAGSRFSQYDLLENLPGSVHAGHLLSTLLFTAGCF